MLNALRLRYGLTWSSHRPALADYREQIQTAMLLALILIAYGIVGRLDYEEELRQEVEVQARRAEQAEQILVECMNGKAMWVSEDKSLMVACDKAWSTKL